jgi:hypothetical protein
MDAAVIRAIIVTVVVGIWALARCLKNQRRTKPVPPATVASAKTTEPPVGMERSGRRGQGVEAATSAAGCVRHGAAVKGTKELEMDMTRMTLSQIASILERRRTVFNVDEEQGIIRTGYQLEQVGVRVMIAVTHDGQLIQVAVTHDLVVPEKLRVQMAETVVRANFCLTVGRFDFDMSTGRLGFHASAPLSDAGISEQQFDMLMAAALHTVSRYHRAFCRLVYADDMSPAEVIAEVEMAETAEDRRQDEKGEKR